MTRTVFLDVDTQIDFLFPAGSLYVPAAERILPAIARLNRYASTQGMPLISTLDTHDEDDEEFRRHGYPAHCVRGTVGWSKPQCTLCERRVTVPVGPLAALPDDGVQVLLEKHTFDCFTNPALGMLLGGFKVDSCVVYGVVTEVCVADAVMGLLDTGRPVRLVTDAIQHLSEAKSAAVVDRFRSRGGVLTTVDELVAQRV
jgi:nicotinamidase/pyrazinamidase